MSAANLPSILSKHKSGKKVVSAQVAVVWALAEQRISAGEELLLDYGGADFWETAPIVTEFCAVCFSRDSSCESNPLVQCEGLLHDGSSCNVSRHRCCFPLSAAPLLTDLCQSHIRYFRPDHLS